MSGMAARRVVALGAISAFLAVGAGAFGAHGLRARLDAAALAIFETAVRYQMYHALALLLVAGLMDRFAGRWLTAAVWSFVAGTVLFSGSLYLLVGTGARWWGAVTPFGGLAFLVGWLCLVVGALAAGANRGARDAPT
ncbi:MAG TPA: DUF423 domain-containing protein [Gemmatimonadales bacterium]|nr:DUF423 domain-containing protein [Gemmatimonadales bacterium]